jgi:tetratricopeptide (TPR) repeat protein
MHTARRAPVVAAALLLAAASAAAGDFVQNRDGTFNPPIKGTHPSAEDFESSNWQILDATAEEISYTLTMAGGKQVAQKHKAAGVADIILEPKDYPPAWKEANEALASGNARRAAELFAAIGAEKRVHAVVRQKALLKCAQAIRTTGDLPAADAAYDRLLAAFPSTFYVRNVWGDRWEMWMDAGNEDKAKAAIAEYLKLPGITEGGKLEARYATITIDLKKAITAKDKGGIQKCLDQFKSLTTETAGKADLANVNLMARLGQARCLLETDMVADAKGLYLDAAERSKENAAAAAAFNGLGECFFRENTPKGFEEARRCFLRTVTMYADGASPDEVARALYFAGECFFRLQDTEDWKDRARRELNECGRRFGGSEWAKRAARLLPNIPK